MAFEALFLKFSTAYKLAINSVEYKKQERLSYAKTTMEKDQELTCR